MSYRRSGVRHSKNMNLNLSSVIFPKGLKIINSRAFEECSNLSIITFRSNLDNVTISENAFYNIASSVKVNNVIWNDSAKNKILSSINNL